QAQQRLPVDDETMDRPDEMRRLVQGRPNARGGTAPPPPVRGMSTMQSHQVPPPPARRGGPGGPPSARSMPPPLPPPGMAPPQTQRLNAPGALLLTYKGQAYNVDKDRYLLGRSKTQADLRLEDANVSRQHAMIERVGNAWYVVDLGSTNGVYVQGERVARRALRDGDVIEITTHRIDVQLR
ncbi:MAG TPA: FHA domain-containing protein, partial [Labilithrix sp.]